MNPPDRERLVNAWLTYQKNWWAFEALMKLWRESPDEALDVIINLARSADDDELVEAVGPGPLEDLIREHGASMIDAIETRAKSDLRFRQALSHVWIAKEDATSFVGQRYIALGCTPVGAKHCAQPDGPALSSLLVRTGAARRLVRTLMSANGRFATLRLTALGRTATVDDQAAHVQTRWSLNGQLQTMVDGALISPDRTFDGLRLSM